MLSLSLLLKNVLKMLCKLRTKALSIFLDTAVDRVLNAEGVGNKVAWLHNLAPIAYSL